MNAFERIALACFAVCATATNATARERAAGTTFRDVKAVCKPFSMDAKQLNCEYAAKDLRFDIAGVGQPDGVLNVAASNSAGHYFLKVQFRNVQCAVIVPGDKEADDGGTYYLDRAAVSFIDGKVYPNPDACIAATAR